MTIVVSRFSALGDVAICIPIIHQFHIQYPDAKIVFVTKKINSQLFENLHFVEIFTPDFGLSHKGLIGIFKLFIELKERFSPDIFIDLHNVIRTRLLRLFFNLSGIKAYTIKKGRIEKHKLIKKTHKRLKPLKTTFQRYIDVFNNAKFNISSKTFPEFPIKKSQNIDILINNESFIVFAPFAAHSNKVYPIDKSKQLINLLAQKYKIYILGAGEKEKQIVEKWQSENIISLIGKFKLQEEIYLMSKSIAVLTMDSANMHLAALSKSIIFSIWGPTHPYVGFTPITSSKMIIIQKELFCRPCSVYGNKKCYLNTIECMNIEPHQIANMIFSTLKILD